ncbi:hypothetical protein CWO04_22290 [Vibrio splendidus]|uniref:hypothetical protein n=1 Tax=Vibrio splendidus TaxID=29497 RepID=UPI000D39F7F4|nr:hypothetical protein [Vibrio splendidus]PTP81532.1 hypothetical protein CWO04_22290 [Vibrio splendidus]
MNKQQLAQYLSFSAIPLSLIWLVVDFSVEPIIVGILGVSNVIGSGVPWNFRKYNSNKLSGKVSFNYNKNNKKYTFGKDECEFETQWSTASDTSIHSYARTPTVTGVSVVTDAANITDILDSSSYEFTGTETPQRGEILLLKNKFGNYAALKIINITDRTRNGIEDELTVEYVINSNGCTDFRK